MNIIKMLYQGTGYLILFSAINNIQSGEYQTGLQLLKSIGREVASQMPDYLYWEARAVEGMGLKDGTDNFHARASIASAITQYKGYVERNLSGSTMIDDAKKRIIRLANT